MVGKTHSEVFDNVPNIVTLFVAGELASLEVNVDGIYSQTSMKINTHS
jgi:hypothetical protein